MKKIIQKTLVVLVTVVSAVIIITPCLILDPILCLLSRIIYGRKFSILAIMAKKTGNFANRFKDK